VSSAAGVCMLRPRDRIRPKAAVHNRRSTVAEPRLGGQAPQQYVQLMPFREAEKYQKAYA